MMILDLWQSNLFVVVALMSGLWIWSVIRKDVSVVDPWWSMGFLFITAHTLYSHPASQAKVLLCVLVAIWAFRLWGYLLWRSRGEGEDSRYQAFRKKYGEMYWLISLVQVFGLQGVLMLIISTPLQLAMAKPGPDQVMVNDLLGGLLVLVGLSFEAIGDAQLAQFKSDPDNEGEVMDQGLWRYTRHPNYFGECVLWWGFWLCASDAPYGIISVFSPLLMTFLLLRVSGVTMLEDSLKERKPKYQDYVERTSAFFPMPPKKKRGRS